MGTLAGLVNLLDHNPPRSRLVSVAYPVVEVNAQLLHRSVGRYRSIRLI